MSIYGIRSPNNGTPFPVERQPTAPANGRVEHRHVPPAPSGPEQAQRAGGPPASLPVHPPPGTDPELWSVLSAEERVFFAKLGAMGPLTYGRVLSQQQQPPVPATRGGRLDVKV